MAANALIGALRVSLGLDSAQFEAGLKQAKSRLDGFGKSLRAGMVVAGAAATASMVALGYAVKGAVDHADEIGKLSQKVGVSVEALSRMEYAASLADVSIESLGTGLRKLGQNMSELANGGIGPARTALDALGVSVVGANGKLLSSDLVFGQIADRFSHMEDGAEKTAIAVALFGKGGSELIPMLNEGASGLQSLYDEADRLGITLNGRTTAGAEAFNDSLTRVQATFQGIINRIAQGVMPALEGLATTLSSPEFAQAVTDFANLIINAVGQIANLVTATHQAFKDFWTFVDGPGAQLNGKSMLEAYQSPELYGELNRGLEHNMGGRWGPAQAAQIYGEFPLGSDGNFVTAKPPTSTEGASFFDPDLFEPISVDAGAASAAASKLNSIMEEGRAVFEQTRTPVEKLGLEYERLNKLLDAGAIDQDTYTRAIKAAQDELVPLNDGLAQFAEDGKDAFVSVGEAAFDAITGVKDFGEAFREIALDFAKQQFSTTFSNLISGIGQPTGGVGGRDILSTAMQVLVGVDPNNGNVTAHTAKVAQGVAGAMDTRNARNAGGINSTWSKLRG